MLPVMQHPRTEPRVTVLSSQDRDVFRCEFTSEQSLSSSTKGSSAASIPSNNSVSLGTKLELLSRMCQGMGKKGQQVGDRIGFPLF